MALPIGRLSRSETECPPLEGEKPNCLAGTLKTIYWKSLYWRYLWRLDRSGMSRIHLISGYPATFETNLVQLSRGLFDLRSEICVLFRASVPLERHAQFCCQ